MLKVEQETTITFNAEEDTATVWSSNPVTLRQFAKLGITGRQVGPGLQFVIDKKWVRIRKPRPVSAAQRERGRQLAHSRRSDNV